MKVPEKYLHQFFEVGIVLKGLNALVEILLGLGVYFYKDFAAVIFAMAQQELVEDPNDFLATHLQHYASAFTPELQLYTALYLFSHGVVKAFLVFGLLRDKVWAYPASIAILGLFIVYQVVKFFSTHSLALALLTVFDLIVLWLIYHEYRVKRLVQ